MSNRPRRQWLRYAKIAALVRADLADGLDKVENLDWEIRDRFRSLASRPSADSETSLLNLLELERIEALVDAAPFQDEVAEDLFRVRLIIEAALNELETYRRLLRRCYDIDSQTYCEQREFPAWLIVAARAVEIFSDQIHLDAELCGYVAAVRINLMNLHFVANPDEVPARVINALLAIEESLAAGRELANLAELSGSIMDWRYALECLALAGDLLARTNQVDETEQALLRDQARARSLANLDAGRNKWNSEPPESVERVLRIIVDRIGTRNAKKVSIALREAAVGREVINGIRVLMVQGSDVFDFENEDGSKRYRSLKWSSVGARLSQIFNKQDEQCLKVNLVSSPDAAVVPEWDKANTWSQ